MGHVFISYSRKDKDYTSALADDLRHHGFDVWIDDRIDYGDRWWQTIVAAVRACSAFVVVMSPDAEKSEWVEREILLAQRSLKPIFPLLLTGDEFPLLITVQFADVRDGEMPPEDFYKRLARILVPKDNTGEIMTPPHSPQAEQVSNRKKWWAGALVGIVALTLVGSVLFSGILDTGDDKDSSDLKTSAATMTSDTPTRTAIAQADTATPSPTKTQTATASATASSTATQSSTPTTEISNTPSETSTPPDPDGDGFRGGADLCPDVSGTVNGCPPTATPTSTDTSTATQTSTLTNTPALTPTSTATSTDSPTNTPRPTPTALGGGTGEILFASNEDGDFDIYIMDADGKNHRNLTQNDNFDSFPVWSPDGTRIAFQSDRDGNTEIYVMDANGSNPVNISNNPTGNDKEPIWSPDGKHIAYVSTRNRKIDIYIVDPYGDGEINISQTAVNDDDPKWSPDGNQISFRIFPNNDINQWQWYITDISGSNREIVDLITGEWYGYPYYLTSSPDCTLYVFTEADAGGSEDIIVQNYLDGQIINITDTSDIIEEFPLWRPNPLAPAQPDSCF